MTSTSTRAATLRLVLAPTLDTAGAGGLKVGVSIDDGAVFTLTSALEPTPGGPLDTAAKRDWTRAVCDNAHVLTAELGPLARGRHTIKVWRIDDNVVLQKLVLATAPLPPSYLGVRPA